MASVGLQFCRVAEANPLTTPRIELVSVEGSRRPVQRSAGWPRRASASTRSQRTMRRLMDVVAAPVCSRRRRLRSAKQRRLRKTANAMAQRLGAMMGSDTPGGSPVNMAKVAQDSTAALAALSGISRKLDASMTPGRGDVALTLSNVRQMTGRAGQFDVASLNGTMRGVQTIVGSNRDTVSGLLVEGRATAAQTRVMLEGLTASLATTSANLTRASDSMTALTEKLAADPSSIVRARKFEDPPAPGSKP